MAMAQLQPYGQPGSGPWHAELSHKWPACMEIKRVAGCCDCGVKWEGRETQSERVLGISEGMFGFVIPPLKFVITNRTTFFFNFLFCLDSAG
ncbi:unnamed protein product [Tetraodon nigroviridis]|uniref:(spotted green pufferfish) hypothetical protein n=1 Tax=Tetraodon nigroviridis TaxID=99883 RepID=Q4S1Q4_TETNG|nr:unnamed protein product [Tetraodon nigroviridis]